MKLRWEAEALALAILLIHFDARAQECVTCWADKCPQLKGYYPPCPEKAGAKGGKAPKKSPCTRGKELTAGHCCWPTQDWGAASGKCIGPCPEGMTEQDGDCVVQCPEGKTLVAGHCCWPGQDWGVKRAKCIGEPQCPGGLVAKGEECQGAEKSEPPAAPSWRKESGAGLGRFVFGMDVRAAYAAIGEEYPEADWDKVWSNMPVAGEFKTGEVRYFWKSLAGKESMLGPLDRSKCQSSGDYIVFLFENNRLFRVSVRFADDEQCQHSDALVAYSQRHGLALETRGNRRGVRIESDNVILSASTGVVGIGSETARGTVFELYQSGSPMSGLEF